jgi:hypothetical protein
MDCTLLMIPGASNWTLGFHAFFVSPSSNKNLVNFRNFPGLSQFLIENDTKGQFFGPILTAPQ